MQKRRGSVLVQVLITSVIVCMIAAGLSQMLLLQYTTMARATDGTSKKRAAEGALNRVVSYWAANGWCTSPGGGITCTLSIGGSCTGPGGAACYCTVTGLVPGAGNSSCPGQAPICTAGGTFPNCALRVYTSP